MTSKEDRKQEKRGAAAHDKVGVRTDRKADEIRSRSADPGQSSYGGFRNEDPRRQHQADAASPRKRQR